jgi:hypothetical protein
MRYGRANCIGFDDVDLKNKVIFHAKSQLNETREDPG